MQDVGVRQKWDPDGEVVVWFHKVELFRHEEDQRMYRESPAPADLALHKELLCRLLTDGDYLVRLIQHHGFVANTEGVTPDDLKATLQNLRADYRGWHEPTPESERAQILHEVFDVPKPAH